MGFSAQHGASLVGRLLILWPIGGVVSATGDDGLVGVAFQKLNDDLMPDTRDGHHAVLTASPAMFVAPLGADHDDDLRAIHHRFAGCLGAADTGTSGGTRLHHAKFLMVDGRTAVALFLRRLGQLTGVADMKDLPVGVEAAVGMFGD